MKVSSVTGYSYKNSFNFNGKKKETETNKENQEYYNPIDVKKEKKLAVLSSTGLSAAVGAIAGGAVKILAGERTSNKAALLIGAAAAAITLGLSLPSKLYHTNVNATVKKKEMDVFTADRELQKDLTRELHNEVKDPEVSLDKKLEDNLKLRVANNAALVGFKL